MGKVAYADTVHCSGSYYSCTSLGHTDHGYGAASGTSYWGMDTGHNCTNYVAYVLADIQTAHPGNNLGNAIDWDTNAVNKGIPVDTVPSVGSVAQWDTRHGPLGHVAYVEAINSDGSIVVSQDTFGTNTFSWKTITEDGGDWPDKFIHFNWGSTAMINSAGEVWAKTKVSTGGWASQGTYASKVRINGQKMAIINQAGQVWAKDGAGGWVDQGAYAQDVQVTSTGKLIISNSAGQIYAKVGTSAGGWIDQGANATTIRANGDRLALINSAGRVYAKDGISGGGWIDRGVYAQDVQVSSTGRMAILNSAGQVWAKDGLSAGGWKDQGATAVDAQLSSYGRMVLKNSGSEIWAKDGLAAGGWINQGVVATQFSLGN